MTSSRRHVVLLDMDGVLCDFNAPALAFARERFGIDLSLDKLKEVRDICKHPDLHEKQQELLDAFTRQPGYVTELPFIQGAETGVQALLEMGLDLVVLTTPFSHPVENLSDKQKWINARLPQLRRKVVFSKDKALVAGHFLVDDWVSNLSRWNWGIPIAFKQPWNAGFSPRLDWPELPSFLEARIREGVGIRIPESLLCG